MTESTPIIVGIVKSQLLAAHEAIVDIWHAFEDVNAGSREPAVLVEAVQLAVKLLPDDMQRERKLVGRTYWYHPESDSHFMLEHGADHPAATGSADGALCIQIDKERYLRSTGQTAPEPVSEAFEDLLG